MAAHVNMCMGLRSTYEVLESGAHNLLKTCFAGYTTLTAQLCSCRCTIQTSEYTYRDVLAVLVGPLPNVVPNLHIPIVYHLNNTAVQLLLVPSTHRDVLAVLVGPLPNVVLQPQHLVVPLCQQSWVEPAAAVGLVGAHQWGEDVGQHQAQRMVNLRKAAAAE
jgi:hypothetical protein